MEDHELVMSPIYKVMISSLQEYSAAWMIEPEKRDSLNSNRFEFCGTGMMDKHGSKGVGSLSKRGFVVQAK